jgi:hypothetical protein
MAEITCFRLDKVQAMCYNGEPILSACSGDTQDTLRRFSGRFFAVGIVKLAPMRGYILTLKISVISPLYASDLGFCPVISITLKIYYENLFGFPI